MVRATVAYSLYSVIVLVAVEGHRRTVSIAWGERRLAGSSRDLEILDVVAPVFVVCCLIKRTRTTDEVFLLKDLDTIFLSFSLSPSIRPSPS